MSENSMSSSDYSILVTQNNHNKDDIKNIYNSETIDSSLPLINDLSNEDSNEKIQMKNQPKKMEYKKIYDPSLFKDKESIMPYICPLCNGVLDEPTIELCGCHKIYCSSCLNSYLSANENKCPSSNKIIKGEPQFIPAINSFISGLEMKCKKRVIGQNLGSGFPFPKIYKF